MNPSNDSLTPLKTAFHKNFAHNGELGASLALYQKGKLLLTLSEGQTARGDAPPWTSSTLVPIFSAGKPAAAVCVLLALHREGLTPDTPIGHIWPTFPLPEASVAQLLSHQCGLPALDERVSIEEHDLIIELVERQSPAWTPPQHGYHPRMFGPLVEELVRRLTHTTLAHFWETQLSRPLKLDLYFSLPEDQSHRVASVYPGKARPGELSSPFYKAYMTEGTSVRRAFTSPLGLLAVQEMNKPLARQGGFPAVGATASAEGLASFYQACLGTPVYGEPDTIPPEIRSWITRRLVNGLDLTLLVPTAFSAGFMLDPLDEDNQKVRHLFGSRPDAFGHPGAGGSIGLADPASGISFAYTANQLELGVLPGSKTQGLLDTLFSLPITK